MHIQDIMKVLREIPAKQKSVTWKTDKHNGSFLMEDEFVTNFSVMRLAKIWQNKKVTLIVKYNNQTSVFNFL